MRYRQKNHRKDMLYFRNTARKTKAVNVVPMSSRGGTIM